MGPHYAQCITQHFKEKNRASNKQQRITGSKLCEICGKSILKKFYDKHVFNCKMKLEDGDGKDFDPDDTRICCEVCGKEFTGRRAKPNYAEHKKRSHEMWLSLFIKHTQSLNVNTIEDHIDNHQNKNINIIVLEFESKSCKFCWFICFKPFWYWKHLLYQKAFS